MGLRIRKSKIPVPGFELGMILIPVALCWLKGEIFFLDAFFNGN
jgi:hypothetical protein